jgi:glycosyltransferase involved in cell wall biosynthesis
MTQRRIGYILISNVTSAAEHEWFCDAVDHSELDLRFVLFNAADSPLYRYIRNTGFECVNYSFSKTRIPMLTAKLAWIFIKNRPHFIHAHLFEASLIGMLASWLAGIKKRIHTRHHGDLHHVYFPSAVKYDRIINRLSTHIIAVSNGVKAILTKLEHVPEKKVHVIPHGLPEQTMKNPFTAQARAGIRNKCGYDKNWPVIGVVSRFTEWKGIQYVIPAFRTLKAEFPNAHLVLANAQGDYRETLVQMLKSGAKHDYTLVPFEKDGLSLLAGFDVFVHVPVSPSAEAFGQVYIEAMAAGIPLVGTLSGVGCDILKDGANSVVVPYRDSASITAAIRRILLDEDLRQGLISRAREDISAFTFEEKYRRIRALYLE